MVSIALICFALFVAYIAFGFATASLNHFLFNPDLNEKPIFAFVWISWPPVLVFDIIASVFILIAKHFSLDDWLGKIDGFRYRIQTQGFRKRKQKDITA